jgi:indole-3-glycerol phosphate synthase
VSALEPILERTRSEVARRRRLTPQVEVERVASERATEGPRRPFAQALGRPGLSVIAEHKRRSPSAGVMRPSHPPIALEDVVSAYQRGGAAALSILTEEKSFGGTLADLGKAREVTALPILRKDFVVDAYQVPEALVAGADAILLIVAALAVEALESLYARAEALGLGVLVEVHDEAELAVAAALGARVIGINNRDLTTLEVDTGRTHALLPGIPPGSLVVAESGFRTRAELERLAAAGVDAVLVGEALMRAPDIEAACRELTGSAGDR